MSVGFMVYLLSTKINPPYLASKSDNNCIYVSCHAYWVHFNVPSHVTHHMMVFLKFLCSVKIPTLVSTDGSSKTCLCQAR